MARRSRSRRGRRGPSSDPNELWRPVAPPPEPAPIAPSTDPTALLRSLGDPPLPGQGQVAEHYLAAVVERASALAAALAMGAGLAPPDDEDE